MRLRGVTRKSTPLIPVVCATIALAACTSSGTSDSGSTTGAAKGGTFSIAATATPNLDPAQLAPIYGWGIFSTLIHLSAKGEFQPDLATSWKYTDSTNTKFEVTLRSGATFSNGEAFNADAVAASMNRFLKQPGPVAVSAGPVASIAAEGADKVLITYKTPVPFNFAVASLTQIHSIGMILAPASLKDEKSIPTTPIGAGPYKVDAATSNTAAYSLVANDKYWNPDAVKYDKVVIRNIDDPAAQLAAVQSGQVTWASVIAPTSAAAAQSSGLQIISQKGNTFSQFSQVNRGPGGPLADQKVRQAISYALPRKDLVTAIFAGQGTATGSIGVPSLLGYNKADDNMYATDATKAKQLLQEAGVSNLTLNVLAQTATSNLAQAIASSMKEIGVTLNVTVNSGSFPEFAAAAQTKKYDLIIPANTPAIDIYSLVTFTLSPGGLSNAFSVSDPKLDQLMTDAAAKPQDQQDAAYAGVTEYMDQQQYITPVALVSGTGAVSSKVQNVPSDVAVITGLVDPFSPVASEAWSGS